MKTDYKFNINVRGILLLYVILERIMSVYYGFVRWNMSIILVGIIGMVQLILLVHYFFRGLKYKKKAKDKKVIGEELVGLVNQ